MAFGGNTRDLGSIGEEMNTITTLHQSRRRKGHTDPRDGVTIPCGDVRTSKRRRQETTSGLNRHSETLEDSANQRLHYMSDVRIDRITEIETTQRQLEASQLTDITSSLQPRGREGNVRDRIDSLRWHMALSQEEFRQVRRDRDDTRRRLRRLESFVEKSFWNNDYPNSIPVMTPEAIKELINRRVEEALAAHEATRAANALEAENQSQNGSDGGNGNGENGNGGNGNPNENGRGDRPVARECTYQDFMKCQPLNFKGTEGVVGLIRWFEKMETVFHISNCLEKYQVKGQCGSMSEIVVDPLATGDISESSRGGIPDLEDTVYDIVHYMSEVPIDRITEFETAQRQLEAGQLIANRESCLRRHMALSQEEFRQVLRDRDDTRRRLRRLESFVERRLGFHP
ncbi:hypothetical protein Tco_0013850 [Tanacetum coccineum]